MQHDMIYQLKLDPGMRTLGELLQEREWAVHEIERLRREAIHSGQLKYERVPIGPSVPGDTRLTPPRLLRLRDAPRYLGMDKNRFNREVRPCLVVIPIGTQGVAFDRLDLDARADEHKRGSGCPALQSERTKSWETKE